MRVIVVGDQESARDQIARRLRRRNYNVAVFEHGRSALSVIVRDAPGIVLLDMHLSDMTGFEFMEPLRAHWATTAISVIAITSDDTLREASLRAGCQAFITKPIDYQILLSTIEAARLAR